MDMDIYPGASDALQPAPLNQQREREREGLTASKGPKSVQIA